MLPICAARRGDFDRAVSWASGCASRRHSPGKGTLKPDPAMVGGRGELNQAPSLGMAKHLGGVSSVEKSEAEVKGWSQLRVFSLPEAFGQESQPTPG